MTYLIINRSNLKEVKKSTNLASVQDYMLGRRLSNYIFIRDENGVAEVFTPKFG